MAFWILWREPWFKRNIPDMREVFDRFLYQEWYNSLSDEDREYLDKEKARKEKEHKEHFESFLKVGYIIGAVTGNKELQKKSLELADVLLK